MILQPGENPTKRVVVTGGPAAGKTTALRHLERRFTEVCTVVPESATILYSGGFVRSPEAEVVMSAQRAIFAIQKSLENSFAHLHPNKWLICDRGTADGAVYWPMGEAAFFREFETSLERELEHYDAVVFFESSAVFDFKGMTGNRVRSENRDEALRLDEKLRRIYEKHPQFHFIAHERDFKKKVSASLRVFENLFERAELETPTLNIPPVSPSLRDYVSPPL